MKKSNLLKVFMALMIVVFAFACFTACDSTGKGSGITVTFKDGDNVIATKSVEGGSAIDALPTPTKEGATFVGWYTDAELTKPFVADTEILEETTLYAKFAQKSLYIVVDSDGGTAVDRVTVTTGGSYTVAEPTKEGYAFEKYTYVDDEGETKDFAKTGTYGFTTTTRIKANWTIKTYTVTFVNGETSEEKKVVYGNTVSLSTPEKTGYTFDGWFAEGATQSFSDSAVISADLTLYAKFTAKKYAISVNSNGGTPIANTVVTYDETYTLAQPTKEGYTFAGYTYNEESFDTTKAYTQAGDIRLVATWVINKYTVTFKKSDDTEIMKTTDVEYNTSVTAPGPDDGYSIEGIYTNKDFTGDKVNVATAKITADTVWYVKIVANKYSITVINYDSANCEVEFGATYTLPSKEELELAKAGEWESFDGYKFDTQDGATFDYTGTFVWTEDIIVYATYTKNAMYLKSTVTLMDGNKQIGNAIVVDDGTAVDLSKVSTDKTGYTFGGWYTDSGLQSAFDTATLINENTTLYAKYTAKQYTIHIDKDGGTGDSKVTVTYGQNFTLPTLTKSGYTFSKFVDIDEGDFVAGTYMFDKDIDITAVWTRNTKTVTFLNGVSEFASEEVYEFDALTSYLPTTDPEKTGYTFAYWVLNGQTTKYNDATSVTTDLELHAYFTANKYTITLVYGTGDETTIDVTYGETYTLPVTPTKSGYIFNKYTIGSPASDFAQTGTYTTASDLTVTIDWTEDNTLFVADTTNKYFKERSLSTDPYTYVFLVGVTYTFNEYTISTVESTSCISITGTNTFVAMQAGTFQVKFTRNSVDTIRNAKVVNYVNTLGMGDSYSSMMVNATTNNGQFKSTIEAEDYVMDAGISNFVPEISVKNEQHNAITLETANMKVTAYNETDSADVDASLITLSGNVLTFDNTLVGKTLVLTFDPKYDVNNLQAQSLKVKLNNGVNVYTSDELRAEYAKNENTTINILRNIDVTLAVGDYDTTRGGHGQQFENVTLTDNTVLEDIDTGTPYNDYAHGAFVRTTNNQNDNLVINGNYFTVDGSKLPYIDNVHDKYGADGSQFTVGAGYRIANVQIGIFLYRCAELEPSDYTKIVKRYATGSVQMNNLLIEGNSTYAYSGKTQDLGDGKDPLLKMSAGYIGVVVRGGTMTMNNVSIYETEMGFMLDGGVSGYSDTELTSVTEHFANETQATKLNLTNSRIDKSWASSVYIYDFASLTLTNSEIGASCGAAISVDDRPYAKNGAESLEGTCGYSELSTSIKMDMYSSAHINNWISGEEAWFVAYGQSGLALQMKTLLNDAVTPAGLTAIKEENSVQKMNFVIFVRDSAGNSSEAAPWGRDINGHAHIDIQVVNHPQNSALGFFYGDSDNITLPDDAMTVMSGRPYLLADTTSSIIATAEGLYSRELSDVEKAAVIDGSRDKIMLVYIPVYVPAELV